MVLFNFDKSLYIGMHKFIRNMIIIIYVSDQYHLIHLSLYAHLHFLNVKLSGNITKYEK
jgi:hypothetical protein